VEDIGKTAAKACRVYLMDMLIAKLPEANYAPDCHLHVRQLDWTHDKEGGSLSTRDLLPGIHQFVDLFSTHMHATNLRLRTFPEKQLPYERYYIFTLQVSADGAEPAVLRLRVKWPGVWNQVEVDEYTGPMPPRE
jgi:hypothetical protein